MTWVFYDSPISTPSDLAVMIALADEANDDGLSCFPSLRRLADKSRMSVGGVHKRIVALEDAKEIAVWRPEKTGRGKHNRYGLVMGRSYSAVKLAVDNNEINVRPVNLSMSKGSLRPPETFTNVHSGVNVPTDPTDMDPRVDSESFVDNRDAEIEAKLAKQGWTIF